MRRWYLTYFAANGKVERAIVEAGTAAGAICKFMEMHVEIDGGAITSVMLADTKTNLEGMGLPTGPDPTTKRR